MLYTYEQIVLAEDIPQYGLQMGDVGTVVDITPNNQQVTLEFFNFLEETIAVVPLKMSQLRHLDPQEIMHARSVKLV
jgi:hypothetical protein